ncbi:MAG TPA: hypothetical protein VHV55_18820 [Pirellulales bacterium]|nr:hypothetical protein [Pirellulales bacterium]
MALLAAPAWAQAVTAPLGLGGQGMGGSAAFVNPLGAGMGNMGIMPGMGMNGSGFVPGGANMGGQGLSMNQYMGMMMMQSLAGRGGSYGPRRGVANPFVTPNYPSMGGGGGNGQQMSLQQPKTRSSTPKLTPEERKATVRRLVEERKAKAKAAAEQKKAKAAQKKAAEKAPAKQG